MKLTRVEHVFDGSRLIFYYTSESRVDFRELVRDLAAHFRMRIEMRQIGVRDEAKMLGGYGSCGRPLCCTTWLKTFEPVSIKMAKQQHLSLNPSKLSGQCGRLKCCLRYELPNGEGVKHAGCARSRRLLRCGIRTGLRRLRQRLGQLLGSCAAATMAVSRRGPRIGITVGDPAGIGPEIAREGRGGSAGAEVCDAAPLRTARPRGARGILARRQLSAEAGRAGYDAIVAAPSRTRGAGGSTPSRRRRSTRKRWALADIPWQGHTDLLAAPDRTRRASR